MFQHVVQADDVAFNPGDRLDEQATEVSLPRVVDQVALARLLRYPEIAVLLVPKLVLGRGLWIGGRLSYIDFKLDHFGAALLEYVGAALEEEPPEDVFLEFGCVHLAALDVSGFEKVALSL